MSNLVEKMDKPKIVDHAKKEARTTGREKPGLCCSPTRKNVEPATSPKPETMSQDKSRKSADDVLAGKSDHDRGTPVKAKPTKRSSEPTGKTFIKDVHKDIVKEVPMELTPPVVAVADNRPVPIIQRITPSNRPHPMKVAVPRINTARPERSIAMTERPLVLSIHLVPSLPIGLFEIVAEMIEVATARAVVLLYESRVERPVASDIVDIAFLPSSENWEKGSLLPVSFVFEHRLNKDKNPGVYVDVVVAEDCVKNVEKMIDLRGYRCAVPDRKKTLGAAGLVFSHLRAKGEGYSFFGNTLDSGSQLAALQMVAGKQAEVGVLESPVINCYRNHPHQVPGIQSLYVLESLGPLPPYRLMFNKNFQATDRDRIKEVLLGVTSDEVQMEKLRSYGVTGFAEYSEDRYNLEEVKSVVTSGPYY